MLFNFILSPAKELRYALTQLYSDVMHHLPNLHCQQRIGESQEEAKKDIRRSASNLFAAYIRVYFYSPFAQSTPHILNFKLPVEISTQPQPLQDGFLYP